METKICCTCGQEKEVEHFVNKRTQCKPCKKIASQKWRDENKPLNQACQRAHYYKRIAKALQQN
jgi:hypothetical protein